MRLRARLKMLEAKEKDHAMTLVSRASIVCSEVAFTRKSGYARRLLAALETRVGCTQLQCDTCDCMALVSRFRRKRNHCSCECIAFKFARVCKDYRLASASRLKVAVCNRSKRPG